MLVVNWPNKTHCPLVLDRLIKKIEGLGMRVNVIFGGDGPVLVKDGVEAKSGYQALKLLK